MFRIQCSDTGATLSIERIDDDSWHACLDTRGLRAETGVYAYVKGQSIGPFFEELGRDWRGWKGERTWASLERELELRLSMDRLGHVSVHVVVTLDHARRRRAEATLRVDAGQLEGIARMAKAFLET